MSYLLRITPEHSFDVHVLRTFTRDLNAWIVRLQATSPHASDTINTVIYALNLTFRDVERSYLVWRNERVQTILQHGFQYARGRIQAAIYRRELGRPAATFPAIFPSFQFAHAGGSNPSPERSARGLPPAQADGSNYHHGNPYVAVAPNPWNSPQPQAAQFPGQNTYSRPSGPASPPHTGALGGYASGFAPEGAGGRVNDYYPPPSYPPADWKPPDPVPGAPPVPTGAVAAVEVAIRYLETVNKAINICIDLDAM